MFQLGGSGSGDWHFYEYGATGWKYVGMLFSRLGSYAGKGRRCAYPNPFRYDRNGRLHVTWSWREDGTGLNGNHDLGYAYATAHTALTNAANSHSGGTIVRTGTLRAHADGMLGAGDVIVVDTATLQLSHGTSHDYLADDAILVADATASEDLAFTGTGTVGALSLNGGASFVAPGSWGALGSDAVNASARFAGTGLLRVLGGE
ncbi:BNR repeat-containing protein [Lysobacter sp. TLK-CK17T]|uniref:BNR repeat-containing protein n=1 Tax=Marilutibacter chinensis TaxID=2912247 RepID=A0ABS9HQW2_9GAMM|nr:BNR repeat-containing protein [Lysobacter chinensis]